MAGLFAELGVFLDEYLPLELNSRDADGTRSKYRRDLERYARFYAAGGLNPAAAAMVRAWIASFGAVVAGRKKGKKRGKEEGGRRNPDRPRSAAG